MFTLRVVTVGAFVSVLTLAVAVAFQRGADTQEPSGSIVLEPCPGSRSGALCGTYEVWENRETKRGRKISLNIRVLPASGDEKEPDPIVPLVGGPGQAAVGLGSIYRADYSTARKSRDIVLIDQRGTGESNGLRMDFDVLFADESDTESFESELARLSKDADVSQYHSINAAHDLAEVLRALGYEKANLTGGSYGTRMAWVFAKMYPEMVRTMTLKAVVDPERPVGIDMPTDSQASLDRVFEACEQDKACNAAYPDLKRKLTTVIERLATDPVEIKSGSSTFKADDEAFAMALHLMLYTTSSIARVPNFIESSYQGEWTPLLQGLAGARSLSGSLFIGMMLCVFSHEDAPRFDEAEADRIAQGTYLGAVRESIVMWANKWPISTEVPIGFWEMEKSDIPLLLISGGLDPVTPPRHAAKFLNYYTDSAHIVMHNGSHGGSAFRSSRPFMNAFIENGTTEGLNVDRIPQTAFPRIRVGR